MTDDTKQDGEYRRAICPECGMDTVHAVLRWREEPFRDKIAALECGSCGWREP